MSNSLQNELSVFVFSYNRGFSLDACLRSVAENSMGASIDIFDDGSDDRVTRELLQEWSQRVRVWRKNPVREGRVGGLHYNMNIALEEAVSSGTTFALMLQDDMQMVRPLEKVDLENFESYFLGNSRSVELQVSFWPFDRQGTNLDWEIDQSGTASFSKSDCYSAPYSDTGLFHVGRFADLFGTLENSEQSNVQKARSLGIEKAHYRYPFTMFMPFPKTRRGGRRSIPLRIAELLAGSGVHPFDYMNEREVRALFARRDYAPPVARDWLRCDSVKTLPLWSYYGGFRDLRARQGWRGRIGAALGEMPPQIREDEWAIAREGN